MKQKSSVKDPAKLALMKININAQEKYPASINLPKPFRRFCIVILQHQVRVFYHA